MISDNRDTTIPDLNRAIDANGHLQTGLMAWQCIKSPFAAMRLIYGGLMGLSQLTVITRYLVHAPSIAEASAPLR
ncbi:MAG: hypothetical protein F6K09_25355 [Merismopedia sp. SIO2A8]|nr:hypothetical protein [Merismopedia sp. SIO2A8]